MRVLRFIVRNWPLKIGAVLLAAVLYVGMVVLQTNQQWPGTVAIDIENLPANSSITQPATMPTVGSIRYIAPSDVPISQPTFQASLDLADAKVGESDYTWVRVNLVATDKRVLIIDYQPQQIRVTLDPLVHKQVTVQVKTGSVPSGLQPGTPVATPSTVDIWGAVSVVRKVAYAQALVPIDATGLDVNRDVDVDARDATGTIVDGVEFTPRNVHIDIQVGSQTRSESVPVNPVVTGAPAAGYVVTSIEITPPIVSVHGQADALALLKGKVNTKPISIAGATSDVTANRDLDLPVGVAADTTGQIAIVVHLQAQSSTRSLAIGVVPIGAHSDRVYSLSTLSVTITLGGATAALNALDTSTLVANASVADLGVGTFTVQVTVTVPAGIKVVAVSPVTITVTVAAAPSPTPAPSV